MTSFGFAGRGADRSNGLWGEKPMGLDIFKASKSEGTLLELRVRERRNQIKFQKQTGPQSLLHLQSAFLGNISGPPE